MGGLPARGAERRGRADVRSRRGDRYAEARKVEVRDGEDGRDGVEKGVATFSQLSGEKLFRPEED